MDMSTKTEKVPITELPFDLTNVIGEIKSVSLIMPGVYYIGAQQNLEGLPEWMGHKEYYVVTADTPVISDEARAYGCEVSEYPGLRLYDRSNEKSGYMIVDFEVCHYKKLQHLPLESYETLYSAAIYAMEMHPEYFGDIPVPITTPRGHTIRYKTLASGIHWLETDRCEQMLALSPPIWQCDISEPERKYAERIDCNVADKNFYLFFPKYAASIPLNELLTVYPEWDGTIIDRSALMNALCKNYPAYVRHYNDEKTKQAEACSTSPKLIVETPDAGTIYLKFWAGNC